MQFFNPAAGAIKTATNPTAPEDRLIMYVGAHDFPGSAPVEDGADASGRESRQPRHSSPL